MRHFLFVITIFLLITTSVLLWITEGSAPVNTNFSAPAGQVIEPTSSSETGKALIGGAFTLIDQDGKEVRDDMFRGKLMLVFFGFTRCPDICPTTAALMTRVMEKLGDKADQVVPLLITIDPEGDTPAVLKTFLANFDKRFVGLTGTPEQVKVAAAAYKAYYAKAEGKEMVDHSSFLYLMGKDGAYLSHFPDGATDEKIAAGIQSHLN